MRLVKSLFLLVLLTLPLGQLSRLEVAPNVVVYLNDILIPILILVWLTHSLLILKKVYLPPFSLRILIFLLIAILSLLVGSLKLTGQETLVSSLFLIRLVEYVSLYLIGYNLFSVPSFANLVGKIIIFTGFIVALLGFGQVLLIPDFSHLAASGGWDPHQYRLLSTFFDPNFVGGFLVMVTSVAVAFLFFHPGLREKAGLILFGSSLVLAIILTLSRSTYLAFFTMLGVLATIRSRKIFLALLLALLVFSTIPAVQDRILQALNLDDSASARVVSWQNALIISKDHPLLGVGFNSYRFAQEDYGFFADLDDGGHSGSGVDSSLLLVLATTGVAGLVSFLSILAGFLVRAFRQRRKKFSLAFLGGLVALMVHSQFVNSLFYPQIMALLWIGAALMAQEEREL